MTAGIAEFATDFALCNPKWARPSGAVGQCMGASYRLAMWLTGHGEVSVVEIEWEPGVTRDDSIPEPYFCGHFVTVVDDVAIDLTARQFDPDRPYPWVAPYDEWLAWYEARYVVHTARSERVGA